MRAFTNPVREKLQRGGLAFCMALRLARTPEIAMIAQASGFEAFYIDMEHCTISLDVAAAICSFEAATRLLDMGALGIIAPHVDTRAQAQAFAAACRFPPLGARSTTGAGPLQGYRPTQLNDINAQGNAATLLIAMLETPEGVENAEAIASVPGIDVLLIGSNDLCTAMGTPGEIRHPKLRATYESRLGCLPQAPQAPRRRRQQSRACGGTHRAGSSSPARTCIICCRPRGTISPHCGKARACRNKFSV